MLPLLTLRITENGCPTYEVTFADPLELGRQRSGEPDPYALLPASAEAPARLVVARQQESNYSRRHVILQPLPAGIVRVRNGSRLPLPVGGDSLTIAPESASDLKLPFTL